MVESFIQWCQHLALAEAIRSVSWPYPAIEIVHITGFVLVFGSVLIPNMRILGAFMKDTPAADVVQDLAPWTVVGLGFQVISGPLLFITSADKFAGNDFFRMKLALLVFALAYHFGVHQKAARGLGWLPAKLSATLSMASWLAVILAGLGIELVA